MYVCIYTCVYICIHIYLYIYIYTYIYRQAMWYSRGTITTIMRNRTIKGLLGFFFFLITRHLIFVTHHLKYPNPYTPPVWHHHLTCYYSKFSTVCGPHTWNLVQPLLFFFSPFNPQYPNSPNLVEKKKKPKLTEPSERRRKKNLETRT